MNPDFQEYILQQLQANLAQHELPVPHKLYRATRLLAKARAQLIYQQLLAWNGPLVRSGPFQGLRLTVPITEGCSVPKLLGCYEAELHPVIERWPANSYRQVIDVGCAEGYYAVGLARLLPTAKVLACDTNPPAQASCQKLAEANLAQNRLRVSGAFSPGDFQAFAGQRTLVVCDIEGAELQLLDPAQAPALAEFDILVEMHDVFQADLSRQLLARFQGTHLIEVIPCHGMRDFTRFPELERIEPLDRLLAIWEWRSGPTPWAWLRARSSNPA